MWFCVCNIELVFIAIFDKYSKILYKYSWNVCIINNYRRHLRQTLIVTLMAESIKRERFTKVASARVTKIINYLGLLQNCSNRNNYAYDSDDVELMFSEINKALREAKAAYSNELNKQSCKGGFTFKK